MLGGDEARARRLSVIARNRKRKSCRWSANPFPRRLSGTILKRTMSFFSRDTYSVHGDEVFVRLLTPYTERITELCRIAEAALATPELLRQDFFTTLYAEASRIAELADSHGAQTNEKWFPFRESVAAVKLFASVTNEILHIRTGISRYQLLGDDEDLERSIDNVVTMMRTATVTACGTVLEQLQRCGLTVEAGEPKFIFNRSEPFVYRLPTDRKVRHIENVGETVVYLATRFLNLSEDGDVTEVVLQRDASSYEDSIPEPISEERLRLVEARFHNLQSMYDTYIFESDIEQQNGDLPILRGHITIIYHLFSVATSLAHYYIRHMSSLRRDSALRMHFAVAPKKIVMLLFEFPLRFAGLYLESAVQLCQAMIRSYSERTRIVVPIPNYRGFHVRPSTLIAKIVAHYGSPVTMHLKDQEYDAASPLELFRANEAINAVKRRRVADMLSKEVELQVTVPNDDGARTRELQLLFVRLMNEGSIVLYDSNLSFTDLQCSEEATLAEFASRYVVHLMSVAKMDIKSDVTVTFDGDSRALNDLRILAENGYGEDRMGNNIVLPKELAYLSR